MRNLKWITLAAALLSTQVSWGQRPTFLVNGLHPGISLVNMRPTSSVLANLQPGLGQPNVGGWDWFPDGRLFIAGMGDPSNAWSGANGNLLGPSPAFVFSGIPTATTAASVTVDSVAGGFHLPSGVKIVDGVPYVLDNQDGIMKMVDNGSGKYTKQTIYKGLLGVQASPKGSGDRRWDAGLLYKNGYFYSMVGMGLIVGGTSDTVTANIPRGHGSILKIKLDGSTVDTFAAGIRNGAGLNWGVEGEMFYTDNQGSFRPASAMFHVTQGRWFGHPKTPFDKSPMVPPAIIFPYGSSLNSTSTSDPVQGRSPTDMIVLRDMYPGQMLVGENHTGCLHRVFLEKVNGDYQGALFPFSAGIGVGTGSGSGSAAIAGVLGNSFTTSVHRFSYGPDGHLYFGGGSGKGSASQGAWGFQGANAGGLVRVNFTGTKVFEMKAIRSLSSTQMEVQFTEPVDSAKVSMFTVRQYGNLVGGSDGYDPAYGGGHNSENSLLTVTAVSLDVSKTKVTLTITGLKQRSQAPNPARNWGYLVQIMVTGITATSGDPIWGGGTLAGGVGWYTLNSFGPGTDVDTTGIVSGIDPSISSKAASQSRLALRATANGVSVRSPVPGAYTLRVMDLTGKVLASYSVGGQADFVVPAAVLGHGMNVLEAKALDGRRWSSAVPVQ